MTVARSLFSFDRRSVLRVVFLSCVCLCVRVCVSASRTSGLQTVHSKQFFLLMCSLISYSHSSVCVWSFVVEVLVGVLVPVACRGS